MVPAAGTEVQLHGGAEEPQAVGKQGWEVLCCRGLGTTVLPVPQSLLLPRLQVPAWSPGSVSPYIHPRALPAYTGREDEQGTTMGTMSWGSMSLAQGARGTISLCDCRDNRGADMVPLPQGSVARPYWAILGDTGPCWAVLCYAWRRCFAFAFLGTGPRAQERVWLW